MDASLMSSSNISSGADVDYSLGKYPEATLVLAQSAAGIIIVLGVFGNLVTVCALMRAKRLRNITMPFVCNLCWADIAFCVTVLPLLLARYITRQWNLWSGSLCRLYPFFLYGILGTCILNLTFITVSQYCTVLHSHFSRRLFTRRKTAAMIILTWALPFALVTLPLARIWGEIGYDETRFSCTFIGKQGKVFKQFIHLVAFLLPCVIISACYTRIFIVFRRNKMRVKKRVTYQYQKTVPKSAVEEPAPSKGQEHQPAMLLTPSQGNIDAEVDSGIHCGGGAGGTTSVHYDEEALPCSSDEQDSNCNHSTPSSPTNGSPHPHVPLNYVQSATTLSQKRKRYDIKLATTMLVTFLAFVVAFLPFTIATSSSRSISVDEPTVYVVCAILTWTNCCLNPLIYVILNRRFRNAYASLFTCGTRGQEPATGEDNRSGGGGVGGAHRNGNLAGTAAGSESYEQHGSV